MTTKTPSLLLVGAPDPSRDALGQLLADAGFAFTAADSTEDAFHKVQSAPPDLLLISAAAGSGSCNEAIAVARSHGADMRIVVLSAGSAGDRARAQREQGRVELEPVMGAAEEPVIPGGG